MKINLKPLLTSLGLFLIFVAESNGQSFNKNINKDSLFQEILKTLPEAKRAEFQAQYNDASEQSKEFLLIMFSMPRSSKKEMIANLDSNYASINTLRIEYAKMVPKDYVVYIEFNPADKIISSLESIDLRIGHTIGNRTDTKQEWSLAYNSDKLATMIAPLGWTSADLQRLRMLLEKAKCISIENGDSTTIGFARSGMGKYSFKLFGKDLTNEQIKKYNDGCTTIFYKKNIVLEYGGGAIGSQCFPD